MARLKIVSIYGLTALGLYSVAQLYDKNKFLAILMFFISIIVFIFLAVENIQQMRKERNDLYEN